VIVSVALLVGCGLSGGGGRSLASPSLPPLENCIEATDRAQEVVFASTHGEQVVGATFGGATSESFFRTRYTATYASGYRLRGRCEIGADAYSCSTLPPIQPRMSPARLASFAVWEQ
jgi:hypothetical protein